MNDIIESSLNKIIAFIVTPVVTALTGTAAAALVLFLENVSGADLDDAQITALCLGVAVPAAAGAATLGFKYLSELAVWQKLTVFGATDVNLPKEAEVGAVGGTTDAVYPGEGGTTLP